VSNGRGLVALLFSQIGAALGEKTLFVSSERSKDLIIQAASVGFDIRRAHRLGVFKLVRSEQLLRSYHAELPAGPSATEQPNATFPFDRSSEGTFAFDRLISQIRSFGPRRLVISDVMAFSGDLSPLSTEFRDAYNRFLEQLEPLGTTVFIMLPEPTSDVARRFTEFIMSRSTAAIFVGRDEDAPHPDRYQITLIPQIGHVTRKATITWALADLVQKAERVESTYQAILGRIAASRGSFLLPEAPRSEIVIEEVIDNRPEVQDHEDLAEKADARMEPLSSEPEDVVPAQTLEELADQDFDTQPGTPPTSVVDRVLGEALASPISQVSSTPRESATGSVPVVEPANATTPQLGYASTRHVPGGDGFDTRGDGASSRDGFAETLQSFYDSAAKHHTDFLLVAMRVDRTGVSPLEFLAISDGVSRALRDKDALYADPRNGRLVLLMPESTADHAQELFATVKDQLRRQGSPGSEELLRKVSAIVVPNGNPFGNAREFLSYVLDGE
jgi:hypothetical protein